MRKLSLDLDDLQVDSFATSAPQPARGTVAGQSDWDQTSKCVPAFSDDCNPSWLCVTDECGSEDCETTMCPTWNDWACDSGTCG